MTTRLPILAKGLILIAVPLLFQLGFNTLATRMRRDSENAELWTFHTMEVIALAQTCRIGLLTAYSTGQGLVLTGNPAFGNELIRQADVATDRLAQLKRLVSDNPAQVLAAARLGKEAGEFLDFLRKGRTLFLEGRLDPGLIANRRQSSQRILDDLMRGFDRFEAEEQRLEQIRHERLNRSWSRFDLLLISGGLFSVLCTVVIAILFAQSISGRLAILTENSMRLAEGRELSPVMTGGDEITRLDQVFHEMARTVAEAARRERDHAEQLGRRAEELAAVNGQLREKAQENEMFVYSVSHDLRSPLVNLQGFSKELGLIGSDLEKLLDRDNVPPEIRHPARSMIVGEMHESIGFIQSAVTRLSGIIDALLRLSRAGRVVYRCQAVDVPKIVARVVSALRLTIESRGATVVVGELPLAWGDPTAFEQIFANLIGNAVNYLDPSRPGQVEVGAVDSSEFPPGWVPFDRVVYLVRDNGMGIPDIYKGKIFTAFQRLHGDVAKGEGVGLALVRRMVERQGGKIWFDSEAGRGTTFYVALPSGEIELPGSGEQAPPDTAEVTNWKEIAWQASRSV